MTSTYAGSVETPLGTIHLTASDLGLTRVAWSSKSNVEASNKHIDLAKRWLNSYFERKENTKPYLDYTGLTNFQRKILSTLSDSSFGTVSSYSTLASTSGNPGASRAVGSVMAMNPWPIIVPCHRVIRRDSVIGNYSGAGGSETKRWLLQHEGQQFDSHGRIII